MPEEMLEKLCASRYMFSAADLQSQVFYSVLDHYYHTNDIGTGRTTQILAEVQSKYYPVPYVPDTVN